MDSNAQNEKTSDNKSRLELEITKIDIGEDYIINKMNKRRKLMQEQETSNKKN